MRFFLFLSLLLSGVALAEDSDTIDLRKIGYSMSIIEGANSEEARPVELQLQAFELLYYALQVGRDAKYETQPAVELSQYRRAFAEQVLEKLDPEGERLTALLGKKVKSPNAQLRARAVMCMGESYNLLFVGPLLDALQSDPETEVRKAAVAGITALTPRLQGEANAQLRRTIVNRIEAQIKIEGTEEFTLSCVTRLSDGVIGPESEIVFQKYLTANSARLRWLAVAVFLTWKSTAP